MNKQYIKKLVSDLEIRAALVQAALLPDDSKKVDASLAEMHVDSLKVTVERIQQVIPTLLKESTDNDRPELQEAHATTFSVAKTMDLDLLRELRSAIDASATFDELCQKAQNALGGRDVEENPPIQEQIDGLSSQLVNCAAFSELKPMDQAEAFWLAMQRVCGCEVAAMVVAQATSVTQNVTPPSHYFYLPKPDGLENDPEYQALRQRQRSADANARAARQQTPPTTADTHQSKNEETVCNSLRLPKG